MNKRSKMRKLHHQEQRERRHAQQDARSVACVTVQKLEKKKITHERTWQRRAARDSHKSHFLAVSISISCSSPITLFHQHHFYKLDQRQAHVPACHIVRSRLTTSSCCSAMSCHTSCGPSPPTSPSLRPSVITSTPVQALPLTCCH